MIEKEAAQQEAGWSQYEFGSRIRQLHRRDTSMASLATTLGWLFWLLPVIGIVVAVGYLVTALLRLDVGRVIESGRGGDLFGFLFGVSAWGVGQMGHAALDNWPISMMVGALFLLMWLIRNL